MVSTNSIADGPIISLSTKIWTCFIDNKPFSSLFSKSWNWTRIFDTWSPNPGGFFEKSTPIVESVLFFKLSEVFSLIIFSISLVLFNVDTIL